MSSGRTLTRRIGVTGVALVFAWLLLIALSAYAVVVARAYFEVRETRTPALVGLPLAEATRLAEEEGLSLRSYPISVPSTAPNAVTEQSPPAGSIVRGGRTVSVGVNVPVEADRMPTLTGVSEADAVATLRDLSLSAPDVNYAFSDQPVGRLVEQAPAPGSEMSAGDPVRLTVSRGEGPTRIELPELTGLDLEAARTQLTVLGVRRIEAVPTDVSMLRAGTVTEQRPEPGTVIHEGEPVTLGYALEGSSVVDVPDVAGMEPWQARVTLRAAGLSVGPVEVVQREDAPEGVVETRPSGLTAVGAPVVLVVNAAPGTQVDLAPEQAPFGFGLGDDGFGEDGLGGDDVRSGQAGRFGGGDTTADLGPGGRSVPFRFDPAALGVRSLIESDYSLRLVVDDARGERSVIDEDVEAGEPVETTVAVYGDEPLLQTYVNGVFFQAWRP